MIESSDKRKYMKAEKKYVIKKIVSKIFLKVISFLKCNIYLPVSFSGLFDLM